MYSKEFRRYLSGRFTEIYDGKSDIYYFFFVHGIELLKKNGVFSNITSRYWIEAEFAEKLRNKISSKTTLSEIIDFKNVTIFDGVGIKTAILSLKKNTPNINNTFNYKSIEDKKITSVNLEDYKNLQIPNNKLLNKKSWILKSEIESDLLDKIRLNSILLDEIAECKQGIVTGRDRAFVGTKGTFDYMPRELVKTWVKVGDIQQYILKPVEERELVYANNIESINDYPKFIERLEPERIKLSNRREAKSGVIRWFDLQWSRNNELFDSPKLLCRFKAPFNTFALDLNGTYSSADTTIVKIKNKWTDKIDLYFLLGVLNSNVLDFYFKSYGKLMDYRYEYYPGPVSLLPVKINLDYNVISTLVQDLMIAISDENSIAEEKVKNEIQKSVYKLYNLTEDEIKIIENANA